MNADVCVKRYIKEYEKETGRKASKTVRRFAKGLFEIMNKFANKGKEDRAKGLPIPGTDAFIGWASKVFIDDPEFAASMAELVQMAYMDGYEGEAQ